MKLPTHLRPNLGGTSRRDYAVTIRTKAAVLALKRLAPVTATNGEEVAHAPLWPLNFTKGLPHDKEGFVDPEAYVRFVDAINDTDDGTQHAFDVPLGPNDSSRVDKVYRPAGYTPDIGNIPDVFTCRIKQSDGTEKMPQARRWESPRAGHVADLQGADADALAMDAAPSLGSDELTAEIAEVYSLALLRDVPFEFITSGDETVKPAGISATETLEALKELRWFQPDMGFATSSPRQMDQQDTGASPEQARRKARLDDGGTLTSQVVFRGSTPGSKAGPYISQFLLVGTGDDPSKGEIAYGANSISQMVSTFDPERDYMTDFNSWLDVQLGADVSGLQQPSFRRFLTTPRDLASYVRVDQLYQAYLNAALIMAGEKLSFDSGFPDGDHSPTRAPFATFGGPHMLALLTEVSSRGLKSVRRQKFNFHRRGRPERLAAMVDKVGNGNVGRFSSTVLTPLAQMYRDLANTGLTDLIEAHNAAQLADINHPLNNRGGGDERSLLLPMAFIEGSPMHPAYGAGHATVAGACVTILKAFFEMFEGPESWTELPMSKINLGTTYEAKIVMAGGQIDHSQSGRSLVPAGDQTPLTIQGELDKLAANISIGRNMAGVHFYTDYYESLRLGERLAVTILEEQMLTYPEPVSMRFHSFDRDKVTVKGSQSSTAVQIENQNGRPVGRDEWLQRPVAMHLGV